MNKFLRKALLVLGGVILSSTAWAQDVELPTPVYFNDFSSAVSGQDGIEIVGNGVFEYDSDPHFGMIFHNDPMLTKGIRTNYLKLPSDILSHSGETKEMTIGFWVNMKNAADFYWSPLFTAYDRQTRSSNSTEPWPMFTCLARKVVGLNCWGYCDLGDTYNDKGTNAVTSAWLDDKEWHYYTITLTSTTIKVYIDGTIENSWTVDGTTNGQIINGLFLAGAAATADPANEFALTYICLGGNQSDNFNDPDPAFGFDDFVVYNKALTKEQIDQIRANKMKTIIIGKEDNTTDFWSAFSPYYTIEPNKTLTLDFYNYSDKALNYHNWLAIVTNDAERDAAGYTEYVVLRADNYAWQTGTVIIDGKVYDKNTAPEKEPTETEHGVTHSWYKSLTSYFNWDTFKEAMNGAHVILTISRGGNVVNIHADITGSDNNKYYEDFVLPCGDDGTANLRVFLTVEAAHLLLDESKTTITDTEVTGTVSASGYNTFSSIFPLDLSTINGAKAYAATSINANNAVELEEATGKVPAEYGLMVQGNANAKFTVKPTSDATAEIENNMLVGMPFGGQVTKATEGFNYVFGYTDPAQPGFYQVDGVLPTLQAGRAYLFTTQDLLATSTDGAPALTISLGDDETTGIRSIDNGKLTIDNVYYDLSGRRVAQPTKGVYIVNGKKVVIK